MNASTNGMEIYMELFYTVVTYVLAGLLGLCVGSFLNVVIYRVPNGMSLATPSSHCPRCKYVLKWYDNVPVLSYLFLGGKCRKCKVRIPVRYTLVEIANMLLWLLCVYLLWDRSVVLCVLSAIASSVFLCVFFIDLEHKLIFDRFVIILAALGIVWMFFDTDFVWYSHLIGGVAGFAAFWLIGYLFYKLRGIEGLGGGDVKLVGAAGLLLGWERMLLSVLIASILASIVLIFATKIAQKRGNDDADSREYPFAPFLTLGFTVSMFFGTKIIAAYLSLLGF